MSTMVPFDFGGHQVRVEMIDGDPWFVAQDVAVILEYSATSAMTRRLDSEDKGVRDLHTPGGAQSFTLISEAGLYAAIFGSQADGAVAFKRKVTHEILPAIRKTGSYSVTQALPQSFSEALRELATTVEQKELLEAQAELDAPKVAYVDEFVRRGDVRLFRNVAKCLSMKEVELRDDLLARKWIYCETVERWSKTHQRDIEVNRYSAYADKTRYFYPAPSHDAPRFKGEAMHTLKITPRGAIALARLYDVDPSVMDDDSDLGEVA